MKAAILTLTAGSIFGAAAIAGMAGQPSTCSTGSDTMTMSVAQQSSDIVDTAINAGAFNTLVTAVKAADLVDALKSPGPFTVFAPTDDAFAKLPKATVASLLRPENQGALQSVLTFHVVSGELNASDVVGKRFLTTLNGQRLAVDVRDGKVFIDGAQVIKTDIDCSNGVIHVIDSVVLPAGDNIVQTAMSAGKFGTLLAAAKSAGLTDALAGDGPFTVFAPTDEAFAALPAGTVESLLMPENREKLASILKYHVVPGRVFSDQAVAAQSARTLQGDMLRVEIDGGRLRVDNANVIMNDIEASNGVIHVIDRVILPGS